MSNNKSLLRNIIGNYMSNLGEKDQKVVVVNADLSGTCRNGDFVDKYPERSFNVGIAEQNMVSFAAGLACEGFKPYVFSMIPFLTMRACEQCRTDVAYGNRNVKLIGVYAGVSGGISGATHWGIEDCGIMSSIPNIKIFEVSDANLAKSVLDYSILDKSPIYIRSGVEPVDDIYPEHIDVRPGGSIKLLEGKDGAFLCSGVTVQYALEAAKRIKKERDLDIEVIDMYSIKPLDEEAVLDAAKTKNIIVCQDHNVIGGLGSTVAISIATNNIDTKFKILGIDDRFVAMAHASYLYNKFKIDAEGLKNEMLRMITS